MQSPPYPTEALIFTFGFANSITAIPLVAWDVVGTTRLVLIENAPLTTDHVARPSLVKPSVDEFVLLKLSVMDDADEPPARPSARPEIAAKDENAGIMRI